VTQVRPVHLFTELINGCLWRRLVLVPLLLLLGTGLPTVAIAQEMEVPVSIQVPLFLKVMTFDRLRIQSVNTELVVGVTFQSGYRASVIARDEVARAFRAVTGRKIRVVLIDLDRIDREALADALQQQHVSVLYVSPLRAFDVGAIATAAAHAQVITVTGVPKYAELGIAVSVRLEGERPRLLVNVVASRESGADFTAELLKLAQVVQ
jgi:hypothetical protein